MLSAEEKRKEEEEDRLEEERRKEEEDRLAEERRKAEEARLAGERRKEEEAEARLLAEEKRKEEARLLAEEKRKEEARLLAEEKRKQEEARLAEEKRKEDEARLLAEEKRKEEARLLAEEKRKEEEARLAEERRKEDEARLLAEEKRKEEARLLAEEKRKEEARLAEERRKEEARLLAEERKKEEARLIAEERRKAKFSRKNVKRKLSDKEKQRIIHENRTAELRKDIEKWSDRHAHANLQVPRIAIDDLVSLKDKYRQMENEWRRDVIYLRDVQKLLSLTAENLKKIGDKKQRKEVALSLSYILKPIEKIYTQYFPNIRKIKEVIDTCRDNFAVNPISIKNIPSLLGFLREESKKEASFRHLQHRLESTIKALSDRRDRREKSPEYLVLIGILRLFGFSLVEFMFEGHLSKEDFDCICFLFADYFEDYCNIDEPNQKQAYIFNLALHSSQHKHIAVKYIAERIPGVLCSKFQRVLNKSDATEVTCQKFQRVVDQVLGEGQKRLDLKSLLYSLKSQLHFLRPIEKDNKKTTSTITETSAGLEKMDDQLLDALDMARYYPQKLTYQELIMLTSEIHNDVNKKPATLQELPWYFMKHIIGLDSDTRENCHVEGIQGESSSEEEEYEVKENMFTVVHPLDLIYIIFMCADDFLRQELSEKMVRCQYAVPFILPPFREDGYSRNLVLHWGLKNITRNFYDNNKVVNKTMVDVETPLISCLSFGEEQSWKSKLLNKMLSPQQETFWHQGLKGGDCKQNISQGMVEVAWYLPGRDGDNKFPYPVTFANVRQNILNPDVVSDELCKAASVICLFVEEVTDELESFLEKERRLDRYIVIFLHKKEVLKKLKQESKHLQTKFNLGKHQVIRKTAEDINFNSVYEQLKKAIENMTQITQSQKISLSQFVRHVKENECLQVDDMQCHHGYMAAQSILRDIDELNRIKPEGAKSEILPCQADVKSRKQMAALEKELCRQKKRKVDETIPWYASHQKKEQLKLQVNQAQNHIADSFKYFLQCLHTFEANDKKYFLQCLKLGLDERSIQLLLPLYDEYEKCRLEDESTARDKKLKEIDEKLTHGSLGIEHFFREMAVMFENTVTIQSEISCYEASDVLNMLAEIMANTIVEGTAIEIMDGDVVNVPVAWLKAVLNKIENSKALNLFKVAVLGAQSCGKSTLLNTIFGLNFPVSSGRCTRGAYMQLVKVDKSLRKTLRCDFIAVIDSEGLMSRTKMDSSDYDNELSTFIIGLSDLTLVIIKGEGTEMHDVLPLAIHVFLRMKVVGELQACHFVHQNMGAVDVMKIATEIDAFVRELNVKTLAAAKDVGQSDRYTKFTDVLHYDANKDNTYVPGLWDGALPMAKTSSNYFKKMQQLKSNIVKNVTDIGGNRRKNLSTVADFTKRLGELWNAIKYENFILSFKNVLAVEAHRKLTKVYREQQWAITREIREKIQQAGHITENEILGGRLQGTVQKHIQETRGKLTNSVTMKVGEMNKTIMHYFKCEGCKDCSAEVQNRHLLANNENEFEEEIRYGKRTLIREVDKVMDNLEIKMRTDKDIQNLSAEMNDTLKNKVQEVISTLQSKDLTRDTIEDIFENLWRSATGDILENFKRVETEENIEANVQTTIRNLLDKDDHLYLQKQEAVRQSKVSRYPTHGKAKFTVDRIHMTPRSLAKWAVGTMFNVLSEQDVRRLQDESDIIITQTNTHYQSASAPEGRQYNQAATEQLFKEVLEQIDKIHDERYKITDYYKVDLVYHIETRAVAGFTEMHAKYVRGSSPEALLDKKKRSFRDLFIIQMEKGDAAVKFSETVLREILLKNIDEQLSCTELLHDLRVHCGEMFRDIKSIQASIMVDLYRKNEFESYLDYICNYELHVKKKMEIESTKYFKEGNRLAKLARTKIDQIINIVQKAVDQTGDSNSPFMKTFFAKIDSLKISHDEVAAYLDLVVSDRRQFAQIIRHQLQSRVREDVIQTIDFWDVAKKLKEKDLAQFLFAEIVGCKVKCPFCKVPCDSHSGGKTQGNHSATLHRPQGLGTYRHSDTKMLAVDDCCAAVASDITFTNKDTGQKPHPCKEYHKIYPDWTILGNTDPEVEKYWKWVFAKFNAKFAKYYSAQKADAIPEEWGKYQLEQIKSDIEDNYHIPVDIASLTGTPEPLFHRLKSKFRSFLTS